MSKQGGYHFVPDFREGKKRKETPETPLNVFLVWRVLLVSPSLSTPQVTRVSSSNKTRVPGP